VPPVVGTATLSWTASAGNVAYRVYQGTAPGTYAQTRGNGAYVTTPRFTATGLAGTQTHYFAVTAIDAAGNESGYSSEVSKALP
jgi:fibronectin type 3 domain-containing protein